MSDNRQRAAALSLFRRPTMKTCPDCNGDGVIDKGTDDEQRCPTCGGLGVVPDDDDDGEEVIRAAEGAH